MPHMSAPVIEKLGALVKKMFTSGWEPTLLSEEVLASGVWFYDNKIPFNAKLLRQKYDYTSFDLPKIEVTVHPYNLDYIDYSISDEGSVYFWQFEGQGRKSKSPTFSLILPQGTTSIPTVQNMIFHGKHAPNKKIKFARFAGWDAYTQGGFAIMPYVPAPLI